MCGIVGKLCRSSAVAVDEDDIRQMLAMIRHRGPDQFGIYIGDQMALGSARLSIVDLSGGQQPLTNEDGTLWIVFNGEIFNYLELRVGLEARGHQFKTNSDTETILHLYEEFGPACLSQLNGQFAIAIWDSRTRELFLARDPFGVRPLFYTETNGAFIFGSEIKAILSTGAVSAKIDPVALDQIFTFWSTLSPRTVFDGIVEVPPAHYLIVNTAGTRVERYWELDFSAAIRDTEKAEDDYQVALRDLLEDAVRLRLRADVPVGAYLSGGLDSSIIASIIRAQSSSHLDTFSIAFNDDRFDESAFQQCMAKFLGTEHQVVMATHADVGHVFPEVIWHTETPIMRTSPAPMFLLSRLVRQRNYKVVLTGEGADELLGGYDIFKEMKVRRFMAAQPASKQRQLLLQRLYPDIRNEGGRAANGFAAAFFAEGRNDPRARDYSHAIRWRNNRRTRRFLSAEVAASVLNHLTNEDHRIYYPAGFDGWGPLERAQYLESTIFLSQYLLSSQGDRMGMAHSVEGRFPFLDQRVAAFCTQLPARFKMRALGEKYLLKKLGRKILPEAIWKRTKRPYRAPIHRSFFNEQTDDYVRELLSPAQIASDGLFKPGAVTQLTNKIMAGASLGETDDMALAGIISTQLVQHQFVSHFKKAAPLSTRDDVKICREI